MSLILRDQLVARYYSKRITVFRLTFESIWISKLFLISENDDLGLGCDRNEEGVYDECEKAFSSEGKHQTVARHVKRVFWGVRFFSALARLVPSAVTKCFFSILNGITFLCRYTPHSVDIPIKKCTKPLNAKV